MTPISRDGRGWIHLLGLTPDDDFAMVASHQMEALTWRHSSSALSDPEASVASPLLVGSQDDPMLESIHAELDSDETFVPQVKPQQQGT